ncbi:hypothetical protein [Brevundimonas sp.]|uniref:hypothetical protein n=1 Tax=Brevundimonas sp. TaxID=1871086 RepID=UPI000F027811
MIGQGVLSGLIKKVVAGAVAAGCALVAVFALGATIYHLLLLVFVPAGAGAITAALFAAAAAAVSFRFFGKSGAEARQDDDDAELEEEDDGLLGRAVHLVAARPMLGGAAALATAFLFLRNPALATLAAGLFGETERQRKRRRRRDRQQT